MTRLFDLAKPAGELLRSGLQSMVAEPLTAVPYFAEATGMISSDTADLLKQTVREKFGYTPSPEAIQVGVEALSQLPGGVKDAASAVGAAADYIDTRFPKSSAALGGMLAAGPLVPARAGTAAATLAKAGGKAAKGAQKAAGAIARRTGTIHAAPAARGASVAPTSSSMLSLPPHRPTLALPEPQGRHWDRFAEATVSRERMPDGQYVGAPQGVNTPALRDQKVREYADRIKEAYTKGVQPGYFYDEGRKAIERVSDTPDTAHKAARIMGQTTFDATPEQNWGWAVQALNQDAMGASINVGKYPNTVRGNVTETLLGNDPYIGMKGQSFSDALDVTNPSNRWGPAPVDQQELASIGYVTSTGNAIKGASPTQTAFVHTVVDEARRLAAQELGIPLSRLEGQELNWAHQRNGSGLTRDATIQTSIPRWRFQHSWETAPGGAPPEIKAQWANLTPEQKQAYHRGIVDTVIDPKTGKDRLVGAMGGRFQEPAIEGPGYWNNEVNPGVQSLSQTHHTISGGLDPADAARLYWTEYMRALMLDQGAFGGHGSTYRKAGMFDLPGAPADVGPANMLDVSAVGTDFQPYLDAQKKVNKELAKTGVTRLTTKQRPTDAEVRAIGSMLDHKVPDTLPVVSPEGINVIHSGQGPNPTMARNIDEQADTIRRILGDDVGIEHQIRSAELYEDMPAYGTRTKSMLERMPQDERAPALMQRAFGADTRALMGDLHKELVRQAASGVPVDPGIIRLTEAWSRGLEAVKEGVKQGIFPAAALTTAIGLASQHQQQQKKKRTS